MVFDISFEAEIEKEAGRLTSVELQYMQILVILRIITGVSSRVQQLEIFVIWDRNAIVVNV